MKRALILVAIILGGAACSIFHGRVRPYPTGVIFPLAMTEGVPVEGKVLRSLSSSAGRLYFSTDKGQVACLDEASRKILWTYEAGALLGCPPAVGERSAAVWDFDNVVHAFDLDGKALWKAALPEPPGSDISAARDRFYLGTKAGRLIALDAASGARLWSFETGGAVEAACATWLDKVVVGSTDGKIYLLSGGGKLLKRFDAGSAIRVAPLVDRSRLYFGTEDGRYLCLDLPTCEKRWQMRTDGRVLSPSIADDDRVYFSASNTVLYAIDKSGGDIVWWAILPSRSSFRPELAGEKLLASCAAPVILCLGRKRGENLGRYDTGAEVRSNPVWAPPDIFVAEYDAMSGKGSLAVLHKEIKVDLAASLASPRPVGAEIGMTATAVGFFEPKYEFFIRSEGQTSVTQKESPKNTWTWYPDKTGEFTLGVKVRDARQTKEAEITYKIAK